MTSAETAMQALRAQLASGRYRTLERAVVNWIANRLEGCVPGPDPDAIRRNETILVECEELVAEYGYELTRKDRWINDE